MDLEKLEKKAEKATARTNKARDKLPSRMAWNYRTLKQWCRK